MNGARPAPSPIPHDETRWVSVRVMLPRYDFHRLKAAAGSDRIGEYVRVAVRRRLDADMVRSR